jgi:hypothetical protein
MPIYTNFSADPALNNKAPPLGSPEGALPFKQISDTLRTLMAAVKEIGDLAAAVVAATETAAGTVELATSAEVQAQADAVRAITPAGLGACTATATRRGVVELATTAEFLTGTDTERAVTAAAFAANVSKANPGYVKLPSGLLIQFGNSTTQSGGTRSITYPVAHATTVLALIPAVLSPTENYQIRSTDSSVSSFSVQMYTLPGAAAPAGVAFFWFSVGY